MDNDSSNDLVGIVTWHGKEHRAQWRLVAENADSACDPCQVIFRLCLVGRNGEIIDRDATISGGEWCVWKRIAEAAKLPIMKPRPKPPLHDFAVDA